MRHRLPAHQRAGGIHGALTFAAAGTLLTLLIPETAGRRLEDISDEDRVVAEAEAILADAAERTTP